MADVKRCDICRFHLYWDDSDYGRLVFRHKCERNILEFPNADYCAWYEREPGSDDDLGEED
jgi:hypothetical protein